MTMYGLKAAEIYEQPICAAKLPAMHISVIVVISSLTGNDLQGSDTQLNSKVYKLTIYAHMSTVSNCAVLYDLLWNCIGRAMNAIIIFLRLTKMTRIRCSS